MSCKLIDYQRDCWDLVDPPELKPYGDISGIGVVIGFMGTGYLVVVLLISNYLLAHDPAKDPFHNRQAQANSAIDQNDVDSSWWRPNPIDVLFLGWVRTLPGLHYLRRRFPDLDIAFNKSIISLCDVQIITGLGILISGFLSLRCGLSAYHWQTIVSIAWFSSVSHLAGLTALRSHLRSHIWKRNIRLILMFVLLVLLVVSNIPVGYFDWAEYVYIDPLAERIKSPSYPADPAICYFDIQRVPHIRQARIDAFNITTDYYFSDVAYFTRGYTFESMVASILLIMFGFIWRSFKLVGFLSRTINSNVRRPVSLALHKLISRLYRLSKSQEQQTMLPGRSKVCWRRETIHIILVQPLLASLITLRIIVDTFNSTLFEISWLIVSLVWGTLRITAYRHAGQALLNNNSLDEEGQWTFGQILAVLLLIAPLFTVIGIFSSADERRISHAFSSMEFISFEDIQRERPIPIMDASSPASSERGISDLSQESPIQAYNLYPLKTHRNDLINDLIRRYHNGTPWLTPFAIAATLTIIGFSITALILFFEFFYFTGPPMETWFEGSFGYWNVLFGFTASCTIAIAIGLALDEWIGSYSYFGWKRIFFFWLSTSILNFPLISNWLLIHIPVQPTESSDFWAPIIEMILTDSITYGVYILICLCKYCFGRSNMAGKALCMMPAT
ncbi:hypothetical protein F4775DRAFT_537449 [Biscogniauxia sp. FL1348]|nr:hypothetical protein F4775DRAFT_537449 [Biscogniauxia sp. FL1348]